jgi:hypothetical protein
MTTRPLFIGLAPMSYPCYLDCVFGIIYRIDNTAISNANPPHVFLTMELAAPMWAWLVSQSLDLREYPFDQGGIKRILFLLSGTVEFDLILSHSISRAGGDGPLPLRGLIWAHGHVHGQ